MGLLDTTELAMPGDRGAPKQLVAIREGVPAGVNQRVGDAKRDIDARIEKTAADMVVPFERFGEMVGDLPRGASNRAASTSPSGGTCRTGTSIPTSSRDRSTTCGRGRTRSLEFGREVARLGGCPLAEHGVGRNPVKQELLRQLYGDDGIEEMRAVKRALDPDWKLAPGVIFTRRP